MYPEVRLVDHKLVTKSDRLFTRGGAYSFLSLLRYLIERYAGREIALLTAKVFMIDIDRGSQSLCIIFRGQRDHSDRAVQAVQDFIDSHCQEHITVEKLAYALTKASLETLTRTLASELAERGATINTINPGPTGSGWISEEHYEVLPPRFPSGRIGTPQDAACLVYSLVSAGGGWITGQVIHSEGGFRRF